MKNKIIKVTLAVEIDGKKYDCTIEINCKDDYKAIEEAAKILGHNMTQSFINQR